MAEIGTYIYFTCPECDENATTKFNGVEFKKHLVESHNIRSREGTRTLLTHIDGNGWYSSTYEWKIEGKKFLQHIKNKRR